MTVDAGVVKRELPFDEEAFDLDKSEYDDLVDSVISREVDRLSDQVGVEFELSTSQLWLERPEYVERHLLPLPRRPVIDVLSIGFDDDRVSDTTVEIPDDVIVHDTHLELEPSADRTSWPTRRRSVQVEWQHGFEQLPHEVVSSVIGLVRQGLREIKADGVRDEAIGPQRVTYELPEAVVNRHVERAREASRFEFHSGVMSI